MKQHPVRAAFEQVADRPSTKFRDDLRAQLLADLVAPTATTTPQTTQEIPVTDTPNPKSTRGRTLLGIAAAVIVAVGVTAVVMNRDDADNGSAPATDPTIDDTATTGVSRSDADLAEAALLSEADLGSPWNFVGTSDPFTNEQTRQADIPECADRNAAAGDLSGITASIGSRFVNGKGQSLVQTVVVFPTLEDATRVFEAFAAEDGQCGVATFSSGYAVTAVAVDYAPLAQYGDQQASFGVTTPLEPPQLTHTVWVRVGRAMVRVAANNNAEGATDADPNEMLETALAALVDSIAAELAAG